MCAMFGCDVAAVVVVQASGVSRLAADDRAGRAHTSARRSASVLATVRLVMSLRWCVSRISSTLAAPAVRLPAPALCTCTRPRHRTPPASLTSPDVTCIAC